MSSRGLGGPGARRTTVRIRRAHVAFALALVGLCAWGLLHRPRRSPPQPQAGAGTSPRETPLTPAAAAAQRTPAGTSAPRIDVTVYWPSADGDGLVARRADVFATTGQSDQAKQVIDILLRGPEAGDLSAPLPTGTRLRDLFIDRRGTAYVDLSHEVVERAPGGSTWEGLAVYSVVNSLTRSFGYIRRVQILVEGQEAQTLNGHLDLTEPLTFDKSLVSAG